MLVRRRLHLTCLMKASCQAILEEAEARAHGPTGRRQCPSPGFCDTSLGPLNLEIRTLKNSAENLALGKRTDTKPHSLKSFVPGSFTSYLVTLFICLVWRPQKNFFESGLRFTKSKNFVLVWLCFQLLQTHHLKHRS